jgi:Ca2+-binding EF-hand superfamily protein
MPGQVNTQSAVPQQLVVTETSRHERQLSRHAEDAMVPIDIAKAAVYCFVQHVTNAPEDDYRKSLEHVLANRPFDAETDLGTMNKEGFQKAVLEVADCKDLSHLPPDFLAGAYQAADKDGSGLIDFNEFLYFYYKFSFSEEVLVSPAERIQRQVARENDITYDEIGNYKRAFDNADSNKNDAIDYAEFVALISKLLKVPKGQNMQEKRCKEMWKEAMRGSRDKSVLDFFGFVTWYKRYFMGTDDGSGESPFEAFYHNIRRVPVAHDDQ